MPLNSITHFRLTVNFVSDHLENFKIENRKVVEMNKLDNKKVDSLKINISYI